MTRETAIAAVEAEFARPLSFHFRTSTWRITPRELWAKAYVGDAVTAALAAQPGARVPLVISVNRWRIRTYVAMLDRVRSRAPRNTRLYLRNLRPRFTKPRNGWSVRRLVMRSVIGHALRSQYSRADRARSRDNRAEDYTGELQLDHRDPARLPHAVALPAHDLRPAHGGCRRPVGLPDSDRTLLDRCEGPKSRGGIRPTPPGPRASSRFRRDQAIPSARGGWVSPCWASASTARRRSVDRLFGVPRLHPHAHPGRGMALRPRLGRHAGLHRPRLTPKPVTAHDPGS